MKLKNILEKYIFESRQIWYRGTDKPITKFELPKEKKDRISSYYGYGLYFIDTYEAAKKYGENVSEVTISDSAEILKDRISPKQLRKVYNQLVKEKIPLRDKDYEFYNNPSYGEYSVATDVIEFYEFLGRVYRNSLPSIEEVSLFLQRSGIDGMEVVNDINQKILVIFNPKVIQKSSSQKN